MILNECKNIVLARIIAYEKLEIKIYIEIHQTKLYPYFNGESGSLAKVL